MKKSIVFACAFVATFAFNSTAEVTTASNNSVAVVNPGDQVVGNGTVLDVLPDGSIVFVDQSTGTIRIATAQGLLANIQIGDSITFIMITTPNGNEIIKQIKRR